MCLEYIYNILLVNYRVIGLLARVKSVKFPYINCVKDSKRSKLYTNFNPILNIFLTFLAYF